MRAWILAIGLDETTATKFKENEIDGSMLAGLQKEELESLGVVKLGHHKVFKRELGKLRSEASHLKDSNC